MSPSLRPADSHVPREARILIHHPGVQEWRERLGVIGSEVVDVTFTLDNPTSLVVLRLAPDVDAERIAVLADRLKGLFGPNTQIEVDVPDRD